MVAGERLSYLKAEEQELVLEAGGKYQYLSIPGPGGTDQGYE